MVSRNDLLTAQLGVDNTLQGLVTEGVEITLKRKLRMLFRQFYPEMVYVWLILEVPRTVFQLRKSSNTGRKVLLGRSWRCPCLGVFYIDLRIKRVILH